jgi:uncharacterized protein YdhG (YjbR/CyaY superfamily)
MTRTDSEKLVDAYIDSQDTRFQPHLKRIREIIREEAPQSEEIISYQIPCFKHHYMLVGYGAPKADCVSFYMMSPTLVKSMQQDLVGIPHAGTTLHLTNHYPKN